MKKYWAEFLGTFMMVFAGTGAIVINDLYGSVSHLGIGLTFGLVVMAVIYSLVVFLEHISILQLVLPFG